MRDRTGTVTQIEFLTHPEAAHRRRVVALLTVDDGDRARPGQSVDVEQRPTHPALLALSNARRTFPAGG